MYEVHVSKKGNNFKLSDIDCPNCAEHLAERWRELGYEAEIVKVD